MSTIYSSVSEINDSQTTVMQFVVGWVKVQKTPVPLKAIVIGMEEKGICKETTIYSLKILLCKGYIRQAIGMGGNNKKSFVQLRGLL